jgi:hypothetical protein
VQPENITAVTDGIDFITLPGMTIGISLQVNFEGQGTEETCLIGMDTGKYLIIQTPPFPGVRSKRNARNHIIVRYIYSGRVYGFRCTLIELIEKPHPQSILSYPDKVEYINLRKDERVPCLIKSEVSVKGELYEGLISNISTEGCGFTFNRTDYEELPRLKVNDQIEITVHFRKKVEATVFDATLRTVRMDSKRMSIGLLFTKSGVIEKDAKAEKALQDDILELVKLL